jgi:hypothetical protein
MIIKFATIDKEMPLNDVAREIEEQGKQSIYRTSALLEPQKFKKDA